MMVIFFTPDYIYKELYDALDAGVREVWSDRDMYQTTCMISLGMVRAGKTYELTKKNTNEVEVIYLERHNGKFLHDVRGAYFDAEMYDIREVII
jgi:hypothetical protein